MQAQRCRQRRASRLRKQRILDDKDDDDDDGDFVMSASLSSSPLPPPASSSSPSSSSLLFWDSDDDFEKYEQFLTAACLRGVSRSPVAELEKFLPTVGAFWLTDLRGYAERHGEYLGLRNGILTPSLWLAAVIYLRRFAARTKYDERHSHVLLSTALSIAMEWIEDDPYPYKHVIMVMGLPPTIYKNSRAQFLDILEWNLYVTRHEYDAVSAEIDVWWQKTKEKEKKKKRLPTTTAKRNILLL